jgi:hypothetical protein
MSNGKSITPPIIDTVSARSKYSYRSDHDDFNINIH